MPEDAPPRSWKTLWDPILYGLTFGALFGLVIGLSNGPRWGLASGLIIAAFGFATRFYVAGRRQRRN